MTNEFSCEEGRDDLPIFIHSELDEFGLDPYQFRIYARIARRAGQRGAFESIKNMADGCQMSEGKVKSSIKVLLECGLMTRETRDGSTSIYRTTPKRQWIKPDKSSLRSKRGHSATQDVTQPRTQRVQGWDVTCLGSQDATCLPTQDVTCPLNISNQINPIEIHPEREEAPTLKTKTEFKSELESVSVEVEVVPHLPDSAVQPEPVNPKRSQLTLEEQPCAAAPLKNMENSAAKQEAQFTKFISDDLVVPYVLAWNEEKPSQCGGVKKVENCLRNSVKHWMREGYGVEEFRQAVIYIRESAEEFYRKEVYTMFRFVSPLQAHVSQCYDKHCHLMETNQGYRDRVLGKTPSLDLARIHPELAGNAEAQESYQKAYQEATKPKSKFDLLAEEYFGS